MKTIQTQIATFVAQNNLETGVEFRLLDLLSELGEVAKEILKGSNYGATPFTPPPTWDEELADALFALICLANSTHVDLDSALQNVLQKYATRLQTKGDAGSGN